MVNTPSQEREPSFKIADQGGLPSPTRFVTHDEEVLGHLVSEEQLQMIEMGRRELIAETCLATAGGAVGAVVPAVGSILDFFNEDPAVFDGLDLFQIVVFIFLLGAAIVSGVFWWAKARISSDIFKEIRGRSRAKLGEGNAKTTIQSLNVK